MFCMSIGNIKPKRFINQSASVMGRRAGKYLAIALLLAGGVVSYTGQDTVKAAACAAPTADLGVDSLSFTAPAAAEYTIWTRMVAPDTQNNTINLEVDGNTCYNVGGGSFVATSWLDTGANWVNYANGTPSTPIRLQLTQGAHTLKYVGTKAGVQLDRIIVTSDASCVPVAKGNTDASGRSCDTGDSTPPTANVVSPSNNTSNVVGTVTISATAADPSGIAKVDFLVNNQVVGSDSTGPDYSFQWNSATVANGNQSITVQATDKAGNTTTSTVVNVTTANTVTCSGNPSVPANLRVSSATGTSVSLAWDASTAAQNCQIKEYRIFRDGTQVTSVNATSFNDTGLNPGATHSYTVSAVDSSTHASAQSAAVSGSTNSDSQAPTVPTNLRTSLVTANSVALAWNASTDNNAVASYVVYRDGTQVGTSPSATFSDTSVVPNTSYTYTVAARDTANNTSAQSSGLGTKTLEGATTVQSKMYISPANGSQTVGSQFTVSVRTDIAATTPINSAQADLSYSSNLQFVSIDKTTTEYGSCPIDGGGSGIVSIVCIPSLPLNTGQPSLSGDKLMAKITFKVLSAGTGTIEVQNSSMALSTSNSANVLTSRQGGSYALSSGTTPTPPTPTPPTPTPPTPTPPTPTPTPPTQTPSPTPTPPTPTPPSPTPTPPTPTPTPNTGANPNPSPTPAASTGTRTTTTTIAPEGNSTPVTLPNDSEVELSDPVVVQTVPDSSQSVTKVEYYLNEKLIATIKEPPYTYSVQTDNLRNGKYQLVTKTYYEDGTVDTKNTALTVKNPMNFKQVMLQIGGFAWLIVLVLVIAAVGVWFVFFRKRDDGDYSDSDGYMFGPTGGTTPPSGSGSNLAPPAGGGQYSGITVPAGEALPAFATDLSRY